MKRLYIILGLFVLCMAVNISLPTQNALAAEEIVEDSEFELVEEESETKPQWQLYLEKCMKSFIGLAGISVVDYIFLIPMISKIIKTLKEFRESKKLLEEYKSAAEKERQVYERQLNELKLCVEEFMSTVGQTLKSIEQSSLNSEKIAKIGFGNLKELVTKGCADEIQKVGEYDKKI